MALFNRYFIVVGKNAAAFRTDIGFKYLLKKTKVRYHFCQNIHEKEAKH